MTRRLLLLTPAEGAILGRLEATFERLAEIVVIRDAETLTQAAIDDSTWLVAFGTGVIVPGSVLERLTTPAYNIHPGTPEFPGRDPHHHAVWRKAVQFGATLHVMTKRVDDGPIVAVERFDVDPDEAPAVLLAKATEAGLRLVERLGPDLLDRVIPVSEGTLRWGATKTTRNDMRQLAHVSPLISRADFEQRFRAFDGGKWDNITTELHGWTFRIDKNGTAARSPRADFMDFTEEGFRGILQSLKRNGYRFGHYGDDDLTGRHVIWRHDVDFSMHRASRLARIEAEEGVSATYFVNPHSRFYNLLEDEVRALMTGIMARGHEIGLHFDVPSPGSRWTHATLDHALRKEHALIEMIVERPVTCVSWHNPDVSNLLDFDEREICGLWNAYSAHLRLDYVYCSDSNGYWRYRPMKQVIDEGHERLHLLTHPAWWTEQPMSPSERVDRAVLGRARAVRHAYDALLARSGRRNITDWP